jgi:hypothetical protein
MNLNRYQVKNCSKGVILTKRKTDLDLQPFGLGATHSQPASIGQHPLFYTHQA